MSISTGIILAAGTKKSMKTRFLLLAASVCLLCNNAFAQTQDVSLQVGLNLPMTKSGIGSDVMFGVNYGRFHYNGLGFRAGFQYAASTADIDDVFGLPVAFAYRTSSKSAGERLQTGASGAKDALIYRDGDLSDLLGGFLLNLFSDMEFFAGVTPGYIAGRSEDPSTASWGDKWQYWETSMVEKRRDFSLTLDAGFSLNYSIWRFDLKFTPAVHYNLTGNYVYHVTSGSGGAEAMKRMKYPLRWFFTLNGGLAFRF